MDIFSLVGKITVNYGDAVRGIDEVLSKAQGFASSLGKTMQDAGDKISSVGKSIAPVSVAVGGVLTASTKSASDFTDGMAKMSTLFDTTKVNVGQLSKEFIGLSNETGKSATELAEAGYQALSASVPVEKLGGFIETSANLAKVGFTDTATAVDVMTTAINAYSMETEDADKIANNLVRTQNLGKTTVNELASSMGKIIPTASSMNVDLDNLCTTYVSLTKQGIATAEATTYANSMMNEMGDSGTTVGGILRDLTGKSFQELMADGYSLGDVLEILQNCANDTGTNFNELWGSSEAGKAAIAILNGGVDEFNSTLAEMGSIADIVGEGLEKLDTPSAKINKALNQVKNSGIELGSAFLTALVPTITIVADVIEKVTTWFSGLDDGTKTVIATVMAFIAALSPVLIIGGKVISGIGSIITVVPKIVGAVSGVVSFVTGTVIPFIGTIVSGIGTVITTIGAVISSIGLVPIAIAALVAGVVAAGIAIWQNWDTIKEKASELWGHVKEKFNAIKESISESFSNAKEAITNKVEEIKTNVAEGWEHMKTTITTKMGEWKENAAIKLSEIKTDFATKVSEIKSDWSEKFTGIRDTATNIMQTAKQNVSTKLAEIKTSFSTRVSEIKSDWSTKFTNLKDTAINQIQTAKQNMSTRLSEMKSNFSSKVSAIKSDWSAKFGNIKDIAINRMQTAKQNVSSKLDNIKTAFNEKGGGIKGVAAATFTAIKETIDTQMQGANILTGGKLDSIKSAFSSKLKNAYSTVSSVMENVKSAFASKLEGARTAVHGAIEKIKGLFNFSWSLPKIKLPHFNISGKFSLDPPQMPKIGVEWYKKAMDGGMIMNQPTVFGYNPKTSQLMAGGEAGSETVVGTGSLMNMIKDAVAAENNELAAVMKQILDAIVSLDEGLEGKFYNALLNTKFQVGEREFARLVRAV